MRVGVVGLKMGLYLADWCRQLGMDVVACCDRDADRHAEAQERLPGVEVIEDWRDLLERDLDGVILANDFDAHAPLAIAFLERGIHVLSEAAACADFAEGERLIKAVESSTATYSFAENYVVHPHVRAIREAIDAGELGRINLVEADYLHSMSPEVVRALIGDPNHWRGRIPPTAYCTHTLSPALALTDAWPTEVTAFPIDGQDLRAAVVLVVRLSNGALAVTKHGFLQGEPDSHWSWISVRGTHGIAESVRGEAERAWSVRVRADGWTRPDGQTREVERVPAAVDLNGKPVERRAEGTVLTLRAFQATVERGEPPMIPARSAVAASLVGVAGAESLTRGSVPVAMPDLSGS